MVRASKHKFETAGWVIFVWSALFFLAATIKSGDTLSIVGSALFLAACIVFMVPLLNPETNQCSNCGSRHAE